MNVAPKLSIKFYHTHAWWRITCHKCEFRWLLLQEKNTPS